MPRFEGQSSEALAQAIAADHPSPGCGAAASVALALAAACAGKAFIVSARHRDGDAALGSAAEQARDMGRAAMALAQRDAADFAAVLHSAPGDHEPEHALEADGEAVLSLIADLRALVQSHGEAVIAVMEGDLRAALDLAEACERVQRRNMGLDGGQSGRDA